MLVLSRRPNEKILFPSLGISVEIVQLKGNTVRVGIEAPEDVRVIRAELDNKKGISGSFQPTRKLTISNQGGCSSFDENDRDRIEQQMEEIAIALALAQNQQRQGLADHVDIALEQAIVRLNELKRLLVPVNCEDSVVCESAAKYETAKPTDANLELGQGSVRDFRLEFEMAM